MLFSFLIASVSFVAEEAPKYHTVASPSLHHDGPVQVFVLAGQSNMLGYGLVEPTDSHGGDYLSIYLLPTNVLIRLLPP